MFFWEKLCFFNSPCCPVSMSIPSNLPLGHMVKKGPVADSKAIHPAEVSFWELGDQPLVSFEVKNCRVLGQSRSQPARAGMVMEQRW